MAADLHIHVLTDECTEQTVAAFQSNTIGTRFFNPLTAFSGNHDREFTLYDLVAKAPDIWIGEVSWLKAAVFGDKENFIPNTVAQVHEAIGEYFPVIDDTLIEKIKQAFDAPNDTSYSITTWDKVEAWLNEHKGKQAFTISW